ncbi:hypothetical protein [Pseudomonas fluorescens]|uniref:hypothetical protein n=1 Tax=Pseudomonas fluorescens TaxID=294 RepID=UPI001241E141|nr:hypothetical protein [Pseudomonas fluorescens]
MGKNESFAADFRDKMIGKCEVVDVRQHGVGPQPDKIKTRSIKVLPAKIRLCLYFTERAVLKILKEHDFTEIAEFKAECAFRSHEDEDVSWFKASIELADGHIRLVLDGSEYDFTAQQCGELADGLSTLLQMLTQRSGSNSGRAKPQELIFCKLFHQMIMSRTQSTQRDWLCDHGYDLDGMLFGASGSFRYPGKQHYYQLFLGVNDELFLPILGIEDRIFTFSVEEASWLVEQLCVGGYLLAQFERPKKEKPASV